MASGQPPPGNRRRRQARAPQHMIETTVDALYDRCVNFHGDAIALAMGDQSISYRELGRLAHAIARGLQDREVGHGDTVAFLMANCPEYVACEYAVAKTGAVRVPLATLLAKDDHVYMVNMARCTILIYHEKFTRRVLEMVPELETVRHFIRIGTTTALPHGHEALAQLVDGGSKEPDPVRIDPEDLCGIYFTGGTTGRPKGVMLSHRSWVFTYLIELLELGIGWRERFLFATPLTHAAGCLLLPVLLRGGCCVILDSFDPRRFLEVVADRHITATFLVPTMIYALLDSGEREAYDTASLRNIIYGAAPIALNPLRHAMEVFGPVFTQLFGQTEAPMMISVLRQVDHIQADASCANRVLASAGRPTYLAVVRLLDGRGHEVRQGEAGEIVVRCPNMMSGYLNNPAATRETLRDGWLHTGDVGLFDEGGFLHIVDRKKDMIISGGFNVYPREIEDALHKHPAVKNAAVVGVADEKWGEMVVGVVELREGASVTEEALIGFVKERKGSVLAPKKFLFWQAIPLTNLGKVDKKAIRERIASGT